MTPLRSVVQQEVSMNIEFGEAILSMLKRKAECQLALIAPSHDEHVVEFWRSLLDMQTIHGRLGQERYRLSTLKV